MQSMTALNKFHYDPFEAAYESEDLGVSEIKQALMKPLQTRVESVFGRWVDMDPNLQVAELIAAAKDKGMTINGVSLNELLKVRGVNYADCVKTELERRDELCKVFERGLQEKEKERSLTSVSIYYIYKNVHTYCTYVNLVNRDWCASSSAQVADHVVEKKLSAETRRLLQTFNERIYEAAGMGGLYHSPIIGSEEEISKALSTLNRIEKKKLTEGCNQLRDIMATIFPYYVPQASIRVRVKEQWIIVDRNCKNLLRQEDRVNECKVSVYRPVRAYER